MLWNNLTASNVRAIMPGNRAIKSYSPGKEALMDEIVKTIEQKAKENQRQVTIKKSAFIKAAEDMSKTHKTNISSLDLVLYFTQILTEKGFDIDSGIGWNPSNESLLDGYLFGDFIINW